MWETITLAGLIGFVAALLGALTLGLKKRPSYMKWIIGAVVSLSLLVLGAFNSPSLNDFQTGVPATTDSQLNPDNPNTPESSSAGLPEGNYKVHFLDVGQADSIYIQLPDHDDILIDAGNAADGPMVVSYLQAQGVDDIELLIATHPHEDHIGGLPAVFDAFTVERVIDSGVSQNNDICSAYQQKRVAEGCPYEVNRQENITFGNAVFRILTGYQPNLDLNNVSVVTQLDTGEIEFLFMGDVGRMAEPLLTGDIKSDILKVGHHGSYTSSTLNFLSRVMPQIAVISVGADNDYGHPAPTTLSRLQSKGATVYRTDLNGNVVISTDGSTYTVSISGNTVPPAQAVTTSPSGQSYVGSRSSDKYHYPNCTSVPKIKETNQVWFKSESEAIAAGYVPCAVCKP